MTQITIQQAFDLAVQNHQAGRLQDAEQMYRQILAIQPNHADAMRLLGVIASQLGRNDIAVDLIRRAISFRPQFPEAYSNLGNALHDKGELDEAIVAYRQAIAQRPDFAPDYSNLGSALNEKGELAEAIAAHRKAVELRPDLVGAWINLGNTSSDNGQFVEGIAAYRSAIALVSNIPEIHSSLAQALRDNGQWDESIAAYRQAIALKPQDAQIHYELGNVLKARELRDEAIVSYQHAVALDPNFAKAHNNLGAMFTFKDEFDQAAASYEKALALTPDNPVIITNLAGAMKDLGKVDEAIALYRRVVQLEPGDAKVHSVLLHVLHYHPDVEPKRLLKEHREWARVHADPLKDRIRPHGNNRSPDRRLKIGYVSPDFYNHCESFFTIPLLSNHDHKQFEIFCYSYVKTEDAFTKRIRGLADHWRDVAKLTDEDVGKQVRTDEIDILIDLAMHAGAGRPLIFASRPAPVQVTWLAYPGSTGMDAIDYRLSDPYLDPPGVDEADYTEKTIRLESYWCYGPPSEEPLPGPLPALTSGRFTFGCLNNFCKINEPVLKLWAQVLAATPNSDMLIRAPRGKSQQRILDFLADKSVDRSRIKFVSNMPRHEYLETFNRIDLCLETFPWNGHTTSLDSLWMGVPVVGMRHGRVPVERGGSAILSNAGLSELLADNHEQYVQIAAGLAANLQKLANLRAGMRERLRSSPLMDAPRFARCMESAYRQMWRSWCASAD